MSEENTKRIGFGKGYETQEYNGEFFPLARPITEWKEEELQEPPYIIDRFMCGTSFNSIVGEAKMGKTFLAMQMAWCIQNGLDFMGRKVNKCDVLYLDFELPKHTSAKRILGLQNYFKKGRPYIVDNISGKDVGKLGIIGLVERIKRYREVYPDIKCVFLDSFYKLLNGDANSARDVKAVLEPFHDYTREAEISINMITHTNKNGITDTSKLIYAAGGSAIWGQIIDETYTLSAKNKREELYRVLYEGRNVSTSGFKVQRESIDSNTLQFKLLEEEEQKLTTKPKEEKNKPTAEKLTQFQEQYPEVYKAIKEGTTKRTIIKNFSITQKELTSFGIIYHKDTNRFELPEL